MSFFACTDIRINRIQYMFVFSVFHICRYTYAHKLKCICAYEKKSALPTSREQSSRQLDQLPPPWSHAVTSRLEVGPASLKISDELLLFDPKLSLSVHGLQIIFDLSWWKLINATFHSMFGHKNLAFTSPPSPWESPFSFEGLYVKYS